MGRKVANASEGSHSNRQPNGRSGGPPEYAVYLGLLPASGRACRGTQRATGRVQTSLEEAVDEATCRRSQDGRRTAASALGRRPAELLEIQPTRALRRKCSNTWDCAMYKRQPSQRYPASLMAWTRASLRRLQPIPHTHSRWRSTYPYRSDRSKDLPRDVRPRRVDAKTLDQPHVALAYSCKGQPAIPRGGSCL